MLPAALVYPGVRKIFLAALYVTDSPERAGRFLIAMVWSAVFVIVFFVFVFPPLSICSINPEVVSMIDAAKVRRFLQPCKKNNLANGSVLLGTDYRDLIFAALKSFTSQLPALSLVSQFSFR